MEEAVTTFEQKKAWKTTKASSLIWPMMLPVTEKERENEDKVFMSSTFLTIKFKICMIGQRGVQHKGGQHSNR